MTGPRETRPYFVISAKAGIQGFFKEGPRERETTEPLSVPIVYPPSLLRPWRLCLFFWIPDSGFPIKDVGNDIVGDVGNDMVGDVGNDVVGVRE